uniref:Uncharacterized protein n=1 Tax=Clastoptera arizonana TaxID=38151 RepID=A0A1B6DD04_9HEMI
MLRLLFRMKPIVVVILVIPYSVMGVLTEERKNKIIAKFNYLGLKAAAVNEDIEPILEKKSYPQKEKFRAWCTIMAAEKKVLKYAKEIWDEQKHIRDDTYQHMTQLLETLDDIDKIRFEPMKRRFDKVQDLGMSVKIVLPLVERNFIMKYYVSKSKA